MELAPCLLVLLFLIEEESLVAPFCLSSVEESSRRAMEAVNLNGRSIVKTGTTPDLLLTGT
jgi:hypothetical protein